MSGIYIPDVSLPGEEDFELWIAVRKDGSFTYNVRGGWQDGKQKAVPVPSHGRCIDADALMDSDGDLWDGMWGWSGVQIANAPTIIPAEEGE